MTNETLNPKIWNEDMTLRNGVEEAIRNVVDQFILDLGTATPEVVDIRLVGSNASYNYNEHSDIDVHIVMNFETIPYDQKIMKLYLTSARNKFNQYYSMKIKGLPVEISIEDMNSNVCSNGIYSLNDHRWVKTPERTDTSNIPDVTQLPSYKRLISEIESVLSNPTSVDVKDMINKLYMVRKNSILTDGEYGLGNLLFKAIRNTGLLQELKEELYNILSKELTLESMLENMDIRGALKFGLED